MVNNVAHILVSTSIRPKNVKFWKANKERSDYKGARALLYQKRGMKLLKNPTNHKNRNHGVCPWALGSSECSVMPKTCHQNHQQNMGRARCPPALAAARPPAVCVTNFSWEFLQIRNALVPLTELQRKYLLVTERVDFLHVRNYTAASVLFKKHS